jgi:hypothetical protein
MGRLCAAVILLLCCAVAAAGAPESRKRPSAVRKDAPHVLMDAWLRRLPGRYSVTASPASNSANLRQGAAVCSLVGKGPGIQCALEWAGGRSQVNSFPLQMFVLGGIPFRPGIRLLAEEGRGTIDLQGPLEGDTAMLERQCTPKATTCFPSRMQITVPGDGLEVAMTFDAMGGTANQGETITLVMRRLGSP